MFYNRLWSHCPDDRPLSSRKRGSKSNSHFLPLAWSSHIAGARLVPALPVQKFFRLKPQLDLLLRPFHWITGMDHVPADMNAEISPHGSCLSLSGISVSNHSPRCLNDVVPFPYHHNQRSWGHVTQQTAIERLRPQVTVVLRQDILRCLQHLQPDQLETSLLKPLDYLSNKTTLDSVWFYGDERPLPHIPKTWFASVPDEPVSPLKRTDEPAWQTFVGFLSPC